MDFNLTDEQELIVASYRDYMESENWVNNNNINYQTIKNGKPKQKW